MPTDHFLRAELLRLREIVCEEDAASIDRVLAEPRAPAMKRHRWDHGDEFQLETEAGIPCKDCSLRMRYSTARGGAWGSRSFDKTGREQFSADGGATWADKGGRFPPCDRSMGIVSTGDAEARIAIDRALSLPPGHLGAAGTFARLDSFRGLAPGWDSYGAQPIDPRAIAAAQALLHTLTVVPTARGGVQIEAGDVEVEIAPDGRVVEDAPARIWTYCSDAQPKTEGTFEIAHWDPQWQGVRRATARHHLVGYGSGHEWSIPGIGGLLTYAWRPVADSLPPLRAVEFDQLRAWGAPEDQLTRAQGVPAEWLGEEG